MFSSPESDVSNPALTNNEATSPPLKWGGARGAIIGIPAGSPINLLTYYAAFAATGPAATPLALYKDDTTTAVTQAVGAGKAYDTPAALFGASWVIIKANANGPIYISKKG